MKQRLLLPVLLVTLTALLAGVPVPVAPAEPSPAPAVDFNRDVRPILAKNCFACHGPDGTHRQAGLRLDQREAAVKKRGRSAAVVPGQPDQSLLYGRITAKDVDERMPPKETGNVLTPAQVATLRHWIEQGAPYAEHWAFVKPQRPALPAVKDRSWPRNGVDYFVLAALERAGLKPSAEADKFALLRRVSLDLRGLPPSPQEVDAFAADTSPDAYEKAVDRFLSDPAYGERWARLWLDLARYADSAGYGSDPLRPNIWRYRDWVIDAFNRNLPYDQFTIEQLAGDLLPPPLTPRPPLPPRGEGEKDKQQDKKTARATAASSLPPLPFVGEGGRGGEGGTLEQRIATAFHRNTMTNTEGGTDREEFRVAAVKDRVDTTLQVWMGLTMGCAKCHNHKYDPITNKEYYQFFAFFNQTADNDQPDERPTIPAPTPTQAEQTRLLDARLAELKKQLDAATPRFAAELAKWEAEMRAPSEWVVLEPASARSEAGATLEAQADHSVRAGGTNPPNDGYTVTARTDLKGITAFRLEAIPDAALPGGGSGRSPDGNFVLSRFSVTVEPTGSERPGTRRVASPPVGRFVRVEIPGEDKILSLAEVQVFSGGANVARSGKASQSSTAFDGPAHLAIDGNTDGNYAIKSTTHTERGANPWWEVELAKAVPIDQVVLWNRTDGGLGSRLANFRVLVLDDARKVVWQQAIAEPPNPKRELSPSGRQVVPLAQAVADFTQQGFAVAQALSQPDVTKGGWAVSPRQKETHTATFLPAAPLGTATPVLLTFRLEQRFHTPGHNLGRFRLAVTNDPRIPQRAKLPADVLAALAVPADKQTAEQKEALARHYRTVAPSLQAVRDEMARLEKSRPVAPMLPVMVELPASQRRTTRIMIKGNFLNLGDPVQPAVPAAFHPLPPGAPADRLGVAKWLVDPNNPLTARVAVNRYWAQLWGSGLVATEEDFGTQGELPSHPELLDWLATEYVRLGWDTKALLRVLVTSAAYRQASKVTPELLAKDPRNRLFSRGPRFRLEAEMVRDQALALGGLLSRKLGGPSVYPPQPPGLWQAAFNGQRTWPTSTGEDRYRRGLYTFWRRTIPYPSMTTFDAPSRETCTIRRSRTNTPLQAFVTLNDPVYVEASQALARRIVKEGGATAEERARFALRLCLARPPQAEQVKQVLALYESEREHYGKDAAAALKLATEPLGPLPPGMEAADVAAWTVVANVLLNLDGVMAKG
jgi:mono/diheme cytochrome c family protein